ncbi:hypothetical protein BGX27_004582, partial [Mortierella sp. AM989]
MDAKRMNILDGNDKAVNRSKERQKDEDGLVPNAFVAWAQKRIERNEEISMVSFSNAFGLTREEDAHSAFISLLSSKLLPAELRAAVSKTYELWCGNEGVVYWTWRMAGRRVDLSTGMTVDDLVDRGQKFTRKILQTNPDENGAKAQLHGLTSTVKIQSSALEFTAGSEELQELGGLPDGSHERPATNQATDTPS